MTRDINKEIEKLLAIKHEVDEINEARSIMLNNGHKIEIVSQLMYDFLTSKNLVKQDTFYRITSNEVGEYVEGFRG